MGGGLVWILLHSTSALPRTPFYDLTTKERHDDALPVAGESGATRSSDGWACTIEHPTECAVRSNLEAQTQQYPSTPNTKYLSR